MPFRFNVRQFVFALVLMQVALGVRLVAAQWWQARIPEGKKFAFGDSEGYWELGRTIAKGQEYKYGEYRVFRTPGYPVLLAPLFVAAGEEEPPVMWARVEGALLGTIAVGLVVLMAWKLFDERTAWIAGLIATFYPALVATSIFVLSEAPFLPVMLAHLYAWQRAAAEISQSRWKMLAWAALGGVLCGLGVLIRPSWLLFLPFAGGLTLLFARERWKHLQIAVAMLLTLCLTMSPWWVRNYQVTGKFVPTSLQVGISLADGLNPEADGGSDLSLFVAKWADGTNPCFPLDPEIDSVQDVDFVWFTFYSQGRIAVAPDEVDVDRWYREKATNWAKQRPLRVLQLAAIKFLRMWNIMPNASEFGSWRFRLLYAVTYTPLLLCCLLGLWKFRHRGFAIWILFLPALYFTLLHMVFVSSIRYQQPAILAWLILGAAWLASFRRPAEI